MDGKELAYSSYAEELTAEIPMLKYLAIQAFNYHCNTFGGIPRESEMFTLYFYTSCYNYTNSHWRDLYRAALHAVKIGYGELDFPEG